MLILGSKGFIGSHLAHLGKGITADIRDKEKLRPHFIGEDIVINAAGETKKVHDKEACYTNIIGTRNVVELCQEYGCKLIHLSSTQRFTPYGRSKQASQKIVEEADIKAVILRLCPIVKLDDPLMKWGRRYPIEYLVKDIENIVKNHDFSKDLITYPNEESPYIHKPRPLPPA